MFRTLRLGSTGTLSRLAVDGIFGEPRSAQFIVSATSPSSLPSLLELPEVVVTGRANAGKSTLINAVLGRKNLVHTSKKPGRTKALNFFRVGSDPGVLVIVDAPGYGSRGRPEWGELFSHYVENRKALRRLYILINAKHGVMDTDLAMLRSLNTQYFASLTSGSKFTLQAIITKADELRSDRLGDAIRVIQQKIFDAAPTCLPAIITSALMKPPFGIEDVRQSISEACGLQGTTK